MKNKFSRLAAGLICATLIAGLSIPALAAENATEQETAAASLKAQGIMAGDENGNMHLEDTLTRAQLACLLSPISLNPEHVAWEKEFYTKCVPSTLVTFLSGRRSM